MTDSIMQEFLNNSYLSGANAEYVEGLYEQFLASPDSVGEPWRGFFDAMKAAQSEQSHAAIREQFKRMANQPFVVSSGGSNNQSGLDRLIESYRNIGYTAASLDPLGDDQIPCDKEQLDPATFGLFDSNETFDTQGLLPEASASLDAIIKQCKKVYTSTIGYDFNRMVNHTEREWIKERVEKHIAHTPVDKGVRRQALKKLIAADTLERYLNKKYVGQKRFSAEGTDAMVPMLDYLITLSSEYGTEEVIFGMAHRGRVNVLLNVLGMPSQELYEDFQGPTDFGDTSGDLKYHRGYSVDVPVADRPMHLSLLFNPSHLEYVSTVLTGSVRARQKRYGTGNTENYALPIVLHGDSAFAGEGVVMEALNMSQTRSHRVGGTIHIITNNQIGFTTSDLRDVRTSLTCADAAKIIDAPIFHVNADDLDAVMHVTKLAMEYRMTFHKDVVIDLAGYRRQGHQEADEPSATAPVRYKHIRQHPRSAEIYGEQLQKEGVCTAEERAEWEANIRSILDDGGSLVEDASTTGGVVEAHEQAWAPFIDQPWRFDVSTHVKRDRLMELAEVAFAIPDDFTIQKQVNTMITSRQAMAKGEKSMDWGFGEIMAYATLADEGYGVRMVGQDSRRGTFSHRQSTLFDQQTAKEFTPVKHLPGVSAGIDIYDSELNESGALGFEYGFCLSDPNKLVIWEAQFGDFYNVAQVVVDQFISSGWQKWRRLSGLVMYLPHGYEGQGPEHTSARLERFMQLCAQSNIQVAVPTTPAQMFHLLRRQMHRPFRKPLIIMTPKSLLRHRLATSELEDLTDGSFRLLIPEIDDIPKASVKRVVLCTGKVYYDLLQERRDRGITDIAIIRIEQLYPFPYEELKAELKQYEHVPQVVWCQEEPKNQGAWFVSKSRLLSCLQGEQTLHYVGRDAFAAPSTGYLGLHKQQQAQLVDEALDLSFSFKKKPLNGDQ